MNRPAHPIRRPATYQDVLDAPPNLVAELIRGALHLHPRPARPHAQASSALGARIGGPFHYGPGGPGGWVIFYEPELHLGEDVLVPDLAGWRRERRPGPDENAYFTTPPDWVCEVLSPSTRTYDVTEKRDIYAEHGVAFLWLVDPLARTLEAFRLGQDGWHLLAALHDEAEVRLPPFEAVAFPLDTLWAE